MLYRQRKMLIIFNNKNNLTVKTLILVLLCLIINFLTLKSSDTNAISLLYVKPKILTLRQDGLNDRVIFRFAPEPISDLRLKIFSSDGINPIREVEYSFDGSGSIYWDGKSSNNNYVLPGIYLYQIESDKRVLTGSIIVAR